MLDLNWNTQLSGKSAQLGMDHLEAKIKEAVEKCIPTKKFHSSSPTGKPIWMDEQALRKTRRKHSAWIRYLNTLDGQAYTEYISHRNSAQNALRMLEEDLNVAWPKNARPIIKLSGVCKQQKI